MSYFAGLLFFAGTWGGAMAAGAFVVRRRLPGLAGHARVLAWAILATAALIGSVVLPAAVGILTRGTALGSALLLAALASRIPRAAVAEASAAHAPPSPDGWFDRAAAAFGVLGFVIWVALAAAHYRASAPDGFDAVNAYLPMAARWIQTGSIWHITDWIPGSFYGSGPGNGAAIVASALLPWHDDFVARFAMYPYVLLTAFAVYALARELGGPMSVSALIGVMVASVPVVAQPGLVNALHDPLMYACFAAALAFGVRHNRTGARSDLVLAAVALGIAFGTKYYGYTSVVAVLVIWIVARGLALRRARVVAGESLLAGAIVLCAGGVWMLRNWVVAGNPLLPRKVELLGVTVFNASPNPLGPVLDTNLASYFDDPDVWRSSLIHQFRIGVGLALVVCALAVVVAAVLLVRRARRRRLSVAEGATATVAVMAVALAAVYSLTPTSAPGPPGMPQALINIRYGIPALIAAAGVAGWFAGVLRPAWRRVLELGALAATVDALLIGTATASVTVYEAFAVAAAVVVAVLACRRAGWRPSPPSWRVGVACAVAVAVVAVAAGDSLQRTYDAARYRGASSALDWTIAHSKGGAAIGLGGAWTLSGLSPTYPLFGPRIENSVTYLGPEERGLLTSYTRAGPFEAAVRAGDYDLLFLGRLPHVDVGPARGAVLSATSSRELRHPPEERWARRLGYREVARDGRFVVMRPDSRAAP